LENCHLLYEVSVQLYQALIGIKLYFVDLRQKHHYLEFDSIRPQMVHRIKGAGLNDTDGDVILLFDVVFPTWKIPPEDHFVLKSVLSTKL
jgi:DnaJ-class molecular chaperone